MSILFSLRKRNIKLFFKDKGRFFTSLITPAILLVLYRTFLGNIYKQSIPESFGLSDKIVSGFAGAQIISSMLAVSCVTVAFCSNFLRVQDKANGTIKDFRISPAKPSIIALAYYLSTLVSTLLICYCAAALCFIYLGIIGWYRSAADVFLLLLDVFLLSLFGTALSSLINFFLTSQGQIAAIGTIVSAGYGFISGAYRPISTFNKVLQNISGFLPSVYGTVLMRNHSLNGVLLVRREAGRNDKFIEGLKNSTDCNFYFFDHKVSFLARYLVLILTIVVLILVYILLNYLKPRKKK